MAMIRSWYSLAALLLLLNTTAVLLSIGWHVLAQGRSAEPAAAGSVTGKAAGVSVQAADAEGETGRSQQKTQEVEDNSGDGLAVEQQSSRDSRPGEEGATAGVAAAERAGEEQPPGPPEDDPLYRDIEQFYDLQMADTERSLNVLSTTSGAASGESTRGADNGRLFADRAELYLRLQVAGKLIEAAEHAIQLSEHLRSGGRDQAAASAMGQAERLRDLAIEVLRHDRPGRSEP